MSHVIVQPISVQWQHVFQQIVAAKNTDVSLCPCANEFVLLYFLLYDVMSCPFTGSFTCCHVHALISCASHTNLSTLRLYLKLVACHVELYCVLSIVHYLHSLYSGQNH